MAIIRKKATKIANAAHVILPKARLGQDVVVIFEDELENFKDIITHSHLLNKVQDEKINEIRRGLDDLKARVAFMERFLTSLSDFGKKSNETRTEPQSVPSEASETSLHSTGTLGAGVQ